MPLATSPNSLFDRYRELDSEIMADPANMFDQLHSGHPLFWCEGLNAWVVSRYEDVIAVSKDVERFVNDHQGMYQKLLPDDVYSQVRPMMDPDFLEQQRWEQLEMAFEA